jgi:hypothetical protein
MVQLCIAPSIGNPFLQNVWSFHAEPSHPWQSLVRIAGQAYQKPGYAIHALLAVIIRRTNAMATLLSE